MIERSNSSKYLLVFAIWYYGIAAYLDRVAMSFAGPAIMRDLAMSPAEFGIVLSSFGVGYVAAQIPGGLIADKWGGRAVLVIAPVFWAVFTGMTGFVTTIAGFIVARIGLGISEGFGQGAIFKIQADNYAQRERSFLQGVTLTPIAIAPALAGPIVAYLLTEFSWHWVFFALIIPSLLAAGIDYLFVPNRPLPTADPEPVADSAELKFSLRKLFTTPTFWLLATTWFCFNIAYWGYQGWMPSYLAMERHVDIKMLGALGSFPYLFGFLGLLVFGWLGARHLHDRRPLLLAITYVLAGIALYNAYSAHSLPASIAGLSASAFFLFGGLGIYYATAADFSPVGSRGVFWGGVSMTGQLGGAAAPGIIGVLVSTTGAFASGFTLMVVALGIAAASILLLDRHHRRQLAKRA